MKKLLTMAFLIILIGSLVGCRSNNEAMDIIISSYQQMSNIDTVNESRFDEGEMLGDAYYVIGTKKESLRSVHHYMGEYISIYLNFGELTDEDRVEIDEIVIEYCDYEKEIFITSYAHDLENSFIKNGINYDTIFEQIEGLSIQNLRYILEQLDLL